jgi:hypothetical protein
MGTTTALLIRTRHTYLVLTSLPVRSLGRIPGKSAPKKKKKKKRKISDMGFVVTSRVGGLHDDVGFNSARLGLDFSLHSFYGLTVYDSPPRHGNKQEVRQERGQIINGKCFIF